MQLLDQYREMHSRGHFQGFSVVKFADEIGALCREYQAKTMLDYGAGQGFQYAPPHSLQERWGVEVRCFDPAVPGMDKLPDEKFDAVIATDVLEHIPLAEIPGLLDNIFSRATKFVFLSVCCRGSKKRLPNGQDVHCTILPLARWQEDIAEVAKKHGVPFVLRETP